MNFTEVPLQIVGYNASILPNYTGLIRRTQYVDEHGTKLNVEINTIFHFRVSSDMKIISLKQLVDRTHWNSASSGIEDPRILTDHSFLSITCFTNSQWKPEVSYVEFDPVLGNITKILPLSIEDIPRRIEKNWIFIKRIDDIHIDCLYSINPIHVVRINLETGIGKTIVKHDPGLNKLLHNGSLVELEDGGFLVAVREKDGFRYKHSLFIKLSKDYSLEWVSEPFKFTRNPDYEMCMSMHIEQDTLVACVGFNDRHVSIFRIPLSQVK